MQTSLVAAAIGEGGDLPDSQTKYGGSLVISIETILMSGLIFIGLLSWFEFLRSWYDNTFAINGIYNMRAVIQRLWYAIFVTALVLILLYVVYRISNRI